MLDGLDKLLDDIGSLAAVLSAIMHKIPNEMYALDDIFVRICGK